MPTQASTYRGDCPSPLLPCPSTLPPFSLCYIQPSFPTSSLLIPPLPVSFPSSEVGPHTPQHPLHAASLAAPSQRPVPPLPPLLFADRRGVGGQAGPLLAEPRLQRAATRQHQHLPHHRRQQWLGLEKRGCDGLLSSVPCRLGSIDYSCTYTYTYII